MQILGNTSGGAVRQAATPVSLDMSTVITRVCTVAEARELPRGALVGDQHGGLTFTDSVAYALEQRSHRGWHEITAPDGCRWTVIRLNR
jgi:hypothetical protein